ncbi:unnamed protein product [Rotaria socialis]|uniref:G-protein coupled receptors family 1 profile domain-containing protein n=2 Tax=Rotaria socialis TaxID=392032 RepID=A0A818MKU6_9BILA|nr:unnamed protein product [Rotaria socialis]
MKVDRFWYANETANIPAVWHYGSGVFSLVCLIFGIVSNGLVIFVFIRNSVLQRPRNYFLINLAIVDFGLLLTSNSMHVISSFKKQWIFGQIGCNFYSVCGGVFGLTSISTMAAIALTRLRAVNNPFSSLKLSSRSTLNYLAFAWIYGSMWIMPPLFGWSRFILEGFGTSCTFDYVSKNSWNRSFILLLVIGGFFIPFSVIIFAYTFILMKLSQRGRQLGSLSKDESYSNPNGMAHYFNQLSVQNENPGCQGSTAPLSFSNENAMRNIRRTETRATRTALLICTVFCSAWGPYAFMALVSAFGFDHLLSIYTTAILGMLTKVAACINPLIYALSLNGFRERIGSYVRRICHCDFKYRGRLLSSNIELNRKNHSTVANTALARKRTQSDLMHRVDSSESRAL